jgi:hypothetical protein
VSRHSSRESKKPVQGQEGLHGKEDLTSMNQRPKDSRWQVKKEKKPVGKNDRGEGHRRVTL